MKVTRRQSKRATNLSTHTRNYEVHGFGIQKNWANGRESRENELSHMHEDNFSICVGKYYLKA